MESIGAIEEQGHQPYSGEYGRDPVGHDAAIAHNYDHNLGHAISTVL
ncbi:hypothetical protein [Synechococcus sp. CC9605]|nr:hypothetical protein [Synechococcus sp. CC9605]